MNRQWMAACAVLGLVVAAAGGAYAANKAAAEEKPAQTSERKGGDAAAVADDTAAEKGAGSKAETDIAAASSPKTAADSGIAGTAKAALGDSAIRVAATKQLTLDFDPNTAALAVTDLVSGKVWSSNPADRDSDTVAKGAKKMDLSAQLLLDYVDDQNKPFQLNSYTGSVKDNTFAYKQMDGGVEVTYEFPKAGFTVPVRYSVKDGAFSAAILTDGLVQKGKYKLVNISLLPFFGAGGPTDEGYMLVPDGSGALIHFNNKKSIYRSYNERVYGADQALDIPAKTADKETVRLPVFGLKNGKAGFLSVIHSGAYQAGITADVGGKNSQYNTVYSYLNLMESETNLLLEGTLNEKEVTRSSESMAGGVPYEVRYYFLSGEQSGYAGMAGRYRQYLQEELNVKPVAGRGSAQADIPLLVDFLGGVKKKATFLGIPYNTVEVLTTFKDAGTAVDRLREGGVRQLTVRFDGWTSGGAKDEVPVAIDAESKLGGDKGLVKLAEQLEEQGVLFYPAADPVRLYENGNGFNKFFDAVKGISRAPSLKYEYRLSDGTKNKDMTSWYMLKAEAVKEAVGSLSKSAAEDGLAHLSLQSVGSLVYSDFRRGSQPKNTAGQIREQGLAEASKQIGGLMFDHPNAYTFPYAESLSDVPLYASGFDTEDETVPFYSIAISGLIPAYGEPINLSSSPQEYMLKLIETGTYPAYKFIARDSAKLTGTEFDSLYSADFDQWFGDVTAQYAAVNEALRQVAGQPIVRHEKLSDGVYRTAYQGGKQAVVNYNDEEATVLDMRIPALGYVIR